MEQQYVLRPQKRGISDGNEAEWQWIADGSKRDVALDARVTGQSGSG